MKNDIQQSITETIKSLDKELREISLKVKSFHVISLHILITFFRFIKIPRLEIKNSMPISF